MKGNAPKPQIITTGMGFTIRIPPVIHVRTGHRSNDQGCGLHDVRPNRQRTRQTEYRNVMKDWD